MTSSSAWIIMMPAVRGFPTALWLTVKQSRNEEIFHLFLHISGGQFDGSIAAPHSSPGAQSSSLGTAEGHCRARMGDEGGGDA